MRTTSKNPDGVIHRLERQIITSELGLFSPISGVGTGSIVMQFGIKAEKGTATTRTWASTSYWTRRIRQGYASAASANAPAGVRMSSPPWNRIDGFEGCVRGGVTLYRSGMRAFYGLTNNYPLDNFGDIDPSNALNPDIFGIGKDAADTNWQLMTNDNVGSATKTDLGVAATTSATDVIALFIECPPAAAYIDWVAKILNTGQVLGPGRVTTDLPRNTLQLGPQVYGNTGAGAASCEVDCFGMQMQSQS